MPEIDKIDRKSAIELAKNMRRRVRNLSIDKKAASERLMRTGVGVGAAALIGHMMGGLEHEYELNAAAIDAGDAEDPRTIAGIDKDLAIGILTAGAGALGGTKRWAGFAESAGNGILSGYAYSKMFSKGKEAAAETA